MIKSIPPAGMNDREIVNTFGHVRQPIRYPNAALAMLLPFAPIGEQGSIDFTHRRYDGSKALRQFLSSDLAQLGLGIEGIEMARPAFHEKKDHTFSFRVEMRRLRRKRVWINLPGGCNQRVSFEQICKCQGSESCSGARKKVQPVINGFVMRDFRVRVHLA